MRKIIGVPEETTIDKEPVNRFPDEYFELFDLFQKKGIVHLTFQKAADAKAARQCLYEFIHVIRASQTESEIAAKYAEILRGATIKIIARSDKTIVAIEGNPIVQSVRQLREQGETK
ncbi:MAG: hypothetical protein ACRDF4_08355 [Rhabdochlamydiaceae bacterium]